MIPTGLQVIIKGYIKIQINSQMKRCILRGLDQRNFVLCGAWVPVQWHEEVSGSPTWKLSKKGANELSSWDFMEASLHDRLSQLNSTSYHSPLPGDLGVGLKVSNLKTLSQFFWQPVSTFVSSLKTTYINITKYIFISLNPQSLGSYQPGTMDEG